ncbi:MAG TPA: glycosyltransferase family 1 protein [Solirubrobacteraceae bacterium]|nr:glycosyltransferase family 1 protein [Solirubrobacteraceae bacterium]
MRVAIDARPAGAPRGIGRYVACLLDALRQTADGRELVESNHPRRVDVYHAPWLDGVRVRPPCPQVVTLHDLVALKRRAEWLRTGRRFRLRWMAVGHAARIIVPTEAVAADAEALLGVGRERVAVIPEAVDPAIRPAAPQDVAGVRERYGLPERYLVWVGALERPDPRKRVAALVGTPRRLPLVLVGPTREWAHELPGVTLTGQVPDEDLAAIYTGAHALVFPSDDEGFGLPAVEALACGTPVVACDVPALREVLGARVTFVGCGDLGGLVAAAEAAHRPVPAPPPWTWLDAARATWDVYERAAERPAAVSRPRAVPARPARS